MKRLIFVIGSFFLMALALGGSVAAGGQPDTSGHAGSSYSGTTGGTPTPGPTCPPHWSISISPTIGFESTTFLGVDATASNDVWAVGTYFTDTTRQSNSPRDWFEPHNSRASGERAEQFELERSLIDHWDGSAWGVVPSPNIGDRDNVLHGVDAISPLEAWAVGYYINNYGVAQTLTQRWNGLQWSAAPGPNMGTLVDNQFFAVEAAASDDVWAVGTYVNENAAQLTLIARWNGTAWTVVPSPNPGEWFNVLRDLSVVSPNDVWAVGYYENENGMYRPLALHWDGSTWSVVPNPAIGSGAGVLTGVDGVLSNEVWVVGVFGGVNYYSNALIMRWNGAAWDVMPDTSFGQVITNLHAVDARATNDVWAVGSARSPNSSGDEALTVHWDGTNWRQVPSRTPADSPYTRFYSAKVISPHDVWAVGEYIVRGSNTYLNQALAEHYSTECIPTGCHVTFRDVQQSDYFYLPVRYLACNGVASGYADGTFRPYNNVTRAQLTKLVVLAEGWSLHDPQRQTFRDVYSSSPFYTYVETAYEHGVISGYSCGETCLEFRPNNDVTRAQITKVIVLAREWPLYTPPTPTFRDVPADHPFYSYVETAYQQGIISGYADGTFRPGNAATRGQVSKIIFEAVVSGKRLQETA